MIAMVPLTIGILTHNSVVNVGKAIASVSAADEIIVCDGASTDGTRALAESLGCTVIDQDPSCLDEYGRLTNIAGVRDQVLAEAKYDWVLFLDSDEIASPGLIGEIAQTAVGSRSPAAYRVPRKYMLGGELIECAMTYPSYQVRLVNKLAVERYDGLVHDVPVLRDGEETGTLIAEQFVPQPPFRELWRKWRSYMRLEEVKKSHLSRSEWVSEVVRPNLKGIKWLAYRYYKSLRECRGRRLPIRYELGRFAYEFGVIVYTGRRFVGIRRSNLGEAWG